MHNNLINSRYKYLFIVDFKYIYYIIILYLNDRYYFIFIILNIK